MTIVIFWKAALKRCVLWKALYRSNWLAWLDSCEVIFCPRAHLENTRRSDSKWATFGCEIFKRLNEWDYRTLNPLAGQTSQPDDNQAKLLASSECSGMLREAVKFTNNQIIMDYTETDRMSWARIWIQHTWGSEHNHRWQHSFSGFGYIVYSKNLPSAYYNLIN